MLAAIRLASLTAVLAASFVASFITASVALSHGPHCGVSPNPPCASYVVEQYAQSGWDGVAGYLDWHTVGAFYQATPPTDLVTHWLSQDNQDAYHAHNWGQIGYTIGAYLKPDGLIGNITSPTLYTENYSSCPVDNDANPSYRFSTWSTPTLREQFFVYRPLGSTFYCNQGGYKELYFFKRGSWSNVPFDLAWVYFTTGYAYAGSEHLDKHAMQPNGTACFGSNSSCTGEDGTRPLSLYLRSSDSWSRWGSPVLTGQLAQGGYTSYQFTLWAAFYTQGW